MLVIGSLHSLQVRGPNHIIYYDDAAPAAFAAAARIVRCFR